MKKILATIAVIIIITAVTAFLAFPSKIPSENNVSVDVYFCPEDNCSDALYKAITASKEPKCALYDLKLGEIKDALKGHKLLMDDENLVPGARRDSSKTVMHNKFCVLDDGIATGSFNPTKNGNTKNSNNLLVIRSKLLKGIYEGEFEELWSGTYSGGKKSKGNRVLLDGRLYEVYFCPEDGCEDKVLELIGSANSSIYFMTFSFTSKKIAAALISAADSLEVSGVIESSQNSRFCTYDMLLEAGVDVKLDESPGKMHHKVFIIDDIVVTGSYNPSRNGDTSNDENMLVIHDPEVAGRFEKEFEEIMQRQ